MSKVQRIEITNGDFSVDNFLSSKGDFRFLAPEEDITFQLTDKQAEDLKNLLEVYLQSRPTN